MGVGFSALSDGDRMVRAHYNKADAEYDTMMDHHIIYIYTRYTAVTQENKMLTSEVDRSTHVS